jgi:hypothetical protein
MTYDYYPLRGPNLSKSLCASVLFSTSNLMNIPIQIHCYKHRHLYTSFAPRVASSINQSFTFSHTQNLVAFFTYLALLLLVQSCVSCFFFTRTNETIILSYIKLTKVSIKVMKNEPSQYLDGYSITYCRSMNSLWVRFPE